MGFISRPFLFVFLPVALLVFHLLRRFHLSTISKCALIVASLIFYGWGDLAHLPLFLISIVLNYVIGELLCSAKIRADSKKGFTLILLGMLWDIGWLCYFKYWNRSSLIIPLGMSFYTFIELMYLIDCYSGLVETPYRFIDYAFFASFFPYTVAGPLVKHEEIIPQFADTLPPTRFQDLLFGCTLFLLGLFKKLVFADGLGRLVDPLFSMTHQGQRLSLGSAWIGAIGFTLQLYFDFSGYSDMAVGVGKLFGFNLPFNFNSPYKATNIVEFWKRWHMTLTRFLTSYIYNPIVLHWTRLRMREGKSTLRPGKENVPAFVTLVAIPTLITMLIAGAWHGAGWTFVCFGVLHGFYIVTNHAYRILQKRNFPLAFSFPDWAGTLLTFLGVILSLVTFRSADLRTVRHFVSGMIHWNEGVSLAESTGTMPLTAICALLIVVWFLPNSQSLCSFVTTDSSTELTRNSSFLNRYRQWWLLPLLLLGCIVGIIAFSPVNPDGHSFIYRQF